MLQQGTESRSALQIADRAADLGISLASRASTDASSVSFQSLTRSFPDALELLADVALHPGFPQQEIDRVRSERLAALVQEKNQPFAVATRVYTSALYGLKNAYGYPDIGTADSIKAMTRDELINFWQQNYSPNHAALVIAGNIKLADLKPLLEKQFGAWKPGAYSPPPLAAPDPSDAKLIVVDRPNAQQTTLLFCSLGPKRSTPDYPRIEVMDSVLGGLFSSRINMNLREQHGYTYGAGSFFNYHRGPGPFIVYSDVRTDATAPATVEIFKELSRMRDTPLTPAELKMAKDSIAQSMPGRFESCEEAVGTIAQIYVYDLSPEYFSVLPVQINAVTAEQARAAAQQYIQPEKMTVVAVGDRAKIEPDLKKLDLGKIEIRDTAGEIVQ
jgi:zinc protease